MALPSFTYIVRLEKLKRFEDRIQRDGSVPVLEIDRAGLEPCLSLSGLGLRVASNRNMI